MTNIILPRSYLWLEIWNGVVPKVGLLKSLIGAAIPSFLLMIDQTVLVFLCLSSTRSSRFSPLR